MIDLFTLAAVSLGLYLPLVASVVDVTTGEWLSLTEACKLIPGRPNLATLWRWRVSGIKGVKLRTVVVGRTRFVSREMLAEFVAAVTAAADGTTPKPQTSKQRADSIEEAKRELANEGI